MPEFVREYVAADDRLAFGNGRGPTPGRPAPPGPAVRDKSTPVEIALQALERRGDFLQRRVAGAFA